MSNELQPSKKILTIKQQEKEDRLEWIGMQVAMGYRYNEIVKAFAAKYSKSIRFAKEYMKYFNERKHENMGNDTAKDAHTMMLQLNYLYRKSLEDNNLPVALATLKEIKDMKGLDGVIKTMNANLNVNKNEVDLSTLTDDQLALLAQLLPVQDKKDSDE